MTARLVVVLRREWPLALVLTGVALGLVTAASGRFRSGAVLLAASVVFGAWLRVVLPTDRVGLLQVRGRATDIATLAALGLALTVLALVVPSPN
ncbi:MAG TPA: DUF3017 domain-containing protein [Candidatus Limnocylindria bacterium]|nr:DUF3017 domain-containing protein [Candidatus Limnocylindria bacterium]